MKTFAPALAALALIAFAAPASAALTYSTFSPDGAPLRCTLDAETGGYVCKSLAPAISLSEMVSAPEPGKPQIIPVPVGNPTVFQAGGIGKKP